MHTKLLQRISDHSKSKWLKPPTDFILKWLNYILCIMTLSEQSMEVG